MLKIIRIFLLAVTIFQLTGCLESSFTLSQESRLPKWLEAPVGVSRSDLKVTMDYYSTFSGGEYVFKFYKKHSFFKLKEVNVNIDAVHEIQLKEHPAGGSSGYPKYYAITVNGITDIIEYRKMEPIFYVSDNLEAWEKLGVKK
jgi:hypothetical protein